MARRYIVRLTPEERSELEALVRKGKRQAYRIKHANILLAVDANGPAWGNVQAAQAFHCHSNTVTNVRQRFVEGGLEGSLRCERLWTARATCQQQGRSIFEYLLRAIHAHLTGQPPPSLLAA